MLNGNDVFLIRKWVGGVEYDSSNDLWNKGLNEVGTV